MQVPTSDTTNSETRQNFFTRRVLAIIALILFLLLLGAVYLLLMQRDSETNNNDNQTESNADNQNDNTNTGGGTTNIDNGVDSGNNNGNTDETVTDDSRLEVTLEAQNGSGQNGTVILEEVNGQLEVTLNLDNPLSVAEPAHIHLGSCPEPGAILFPLTNILNGVSVTLLDTTLDDLRAHGNLAINVHKSALELDVYYACGDLF